MKKVIIGGFVSIVGMMGIMAVLVTTASSMVNMLDGWSTPPGRFLSWLSEIGMIPLLVLSSIILIFGLIILGAEYFKKENT